MATDFTGIGLSQSACVCFFSFNNNSRGNSPIEYIGRKLENLEFMTDNNGGGNYVS
ncbi:MAG: hypothetical protein LBI04_00765 [Treponema sp.]|jgi:hypothetical protein|nr:hypothetical protein [Treponema sp.]